MLEAKVIIELPGIADAINNLADAIRGNGVVPAPAKAKRTKAEKNVAPAGESPVEEKPVNTEPKFTPVENTEPEPSFIAEIPPDEPEIPVPVAPVVPETPAPVVPVAPVPEISEPVAVPQSMPPAPAPVKKYTFKQISTAGAKLCANVGNMDKLVTLLNTKYGVPAITMIKEERYAELAEDLKALGATIEEE